jgi:anti-sigma B factor antagonist
MPTLQPFDVQVRRQPRAAIIELLGEVNAAAETALNGAYAQAEQDDPELILLNFERVEYINSTGIALVVGLLARARKSKRRIAACGLSPHYREIFEITRLVDYMPVFNDESAALTRRIEA